MRLDVRDVAAWETTLDATWVLAVKAGVHAILTHVLPHRPSEVILPRHRGWLAKIAMLAVPLAQRLTPLFVQRARPRQRCWRTPSA